MLVNSIRWSECVAMAMESKGFNPDGAAGDRTYYSVPAVRWYDWVCGIACLAAISAGMIFLKV